MGQHFSGVLLQFGHVARPGKAHAEEVLQMVRGALLGPGGLSEWAIRYIHGWAVHMAGRWAEQRRTDEGR